MAQEPPKDRVIVLQRPDGTEGDYVRSASDRTKLHLGKKVGYRRFGGKAHAQAESDEVHRGFAPHVVSVHAWTMPKIGEALDDVVFDCRTRIRSAKDEVLVAKGWPFDLLSRTENMPMRENNE